MGNFKQSDMLYDDGKYYKWTAPEDGDNPNVRGGIDRLELDRTQGFEVLPFINRFGDDYFKNPAALEWYQKVEKMIRYDVPTSIKKHDDIEKWIHKNWNNC